MHRTFASALLAVSFLTISAVQADAQRYYAREKLAGSAVGATYEGTWKPGVPTSTACAAGVKTVSTTPVCVVSGSTVQESKCDASIKPSATTVPAACTLTCGVMTSGKTEGTGGKRSPLLGIATSVDDALRLCRNYSSEKGVCTTNNNNFQTYYSVGATWTMDLGYSWFASVCSSS